LLPEKGTFLHGIDRSAFTKELCALRGELRFEEPLACHTTIGVGGKAAFFLSPGRPHALAETIRCCRRYGYPYLLLGAGSNLLFSDCGYPGLIISTEQLRGITLAEGSVQVFAGEPLPALLNTVNRAGIRSLNFLAGIPGSLGGAIAMNTGIPQRTIGDTIEEVAVLNPHGEVMVLKAKDCGFSYRRSEILEQRLPVLWARLRLDGRPYDRDEILTHRRASQPLSAVSAGCVFKNPRGLSAGRVIDKAGLKGLSVGMAKVSEKHANFIVNLGGARCTEIRKLIDIVRQKVYKSFRILLELEIEVIDG